MEVTYIFEILCLETEEFKVLASDSTGRVHYEKKVETIELASFYLGLAYADIKAYHIRSHRQEIYKVFLLGKEITQLDLYRED